MRDVETATVTFHFHFGGLGEAVYDEVATSPDTLTNCMHKPL